MGQQILCDWSLPIPHENIKKPKDFLFLGSRKTLGGMKWVNE